MNLSLDGQIIWMGRLVWWLLPVKVYSKQCIAIQIRTVIFYRSILPLTAFWFHRGISSQTSKFRLQLSVKSNVFFLVVRVFIYLLVYFSSSSFQNNRDHSRRIYHLVSSAEIKISWKELVECGRWTIENKIPLNGVVWYPNGNITANRLYHNICCVLFHWIPAILIDCLLFCLRYPPV